MYPQSIFLSKNKKNITIFHLKIIIFTAVKYRSILHGHVGVMYRFSCYVVQSQWQRFICSLANELNFGSDDLVIIEASS